MDKSSSHRVEVDVALGLGHLVVGAAAIVLGGVCVVTASSPGAELEGVLLVPGLLLIASGLAFGYAALRSLRSAPGSVLPLVLALVELVTGAAMIAGVAVAVRSYGAFEPWRSPLLVPSLLLIALGLSGALRALDARRA